MTHNNNSKPFCFEWTDYIATIPTQNKPRNKQFKQKAIEGLTLSTNAKIVAICLGTYCRDEKNHCYPNLNEHLRQGLGLTITMYKQGIAELVEKGLVEVMKADNGFLINGKPICWGSNLYVLHIK